VGGKPHAFEEGGHGCRGLRQVGFAGVCHGSVTEAVQVQARVPAAKRMFHDPSTKQWLESSS
jgi:hypothetical protein